MSGRYDLVVLGLSLSSSWGNGHATTFRALLRAAAGRGLRILFLERDKPWYAAHRDQLEFPYCDFALYATLEELERHRPVCETARAVMVGSYVPDGIAVGAWVQRHARGVTAFYDIDTPITLAGLETGDCAYLSAALVPGYDLYLSFTGGPTLDRLRTRFGARETVALYCSVDPALYAPVGDARPLYDLGYLGTYSDDRQPTLERLLIDVALRAPDRRFAVAGPQYPPSITWPDNVARIEHVPPAEHPGFYAACRWTLNVTRADMIRAGWSPSVRLFEAAACGTPIISDIWDGIESVLMPGTEILLARDADDVAHALDMAEPARVQLAAAARARVLGAHTAAHRAAELEAAIARAADSRRDGRER